MPVTFTKQKLSTIYLNLVDLQLLFQIFVLLFLCLHLSTQVKKQKSNIISDIDDIKEFKKLLRTKTNVLVLYINNQKSSQSVLDVVKEAADSMKGQATLVAIDCNGR